MIFQTRNFGGSKESTTPWIKSLFAYFLEVICVSKINWVREAKEENVGTKNIYGRRNHFTLLIKKSQIGIQVRSYNENMRFYQSTPLLYFRRYSKYYHTTITGFQYYFYRYIQFYLTIRIYACSPYRNTNMYAFVIHSN